MNWWEKRQELSICFLAKIPKYFLRKGVSAILKSLSALAINPLFQLGHHFCKDKKGAVRRVVYQ